MYIITGIDESTVKKADLVNKAGYPHGDVLHPIAEQYFKLIVVPQPHPENKLQAIKDNGITALFDNNVENAKAAKSECAVFILWNVKQKSESRDADPDGAPTIMCPDGQRRPYRAPQARGVQRW